MLNLYLKQISSPTASSEASNLIIYTIWSKNYNSVNYLKQTLELHASYKNNTMSWESVLYVKTYVRNVEDDEGVCELCHLDTQCWKLCQVFI